MVFDKIPLPNKCDMQRCNNTTEYILEINRLGIPSEIHLCKHCAEKLCAIIQTGLTEAEGKTHD